MCGRQFRLRGRCIGSTRSAVLSSQFVVHSGQVATASFSVLDRRLLTVSCQLKAVCCAAVRGTSGVRRNWAVLPERGRTFGEEMRGSRWTFLLKNRAKSGRIQGVSGRFFAQPGGRFCRGMGGVGVSGGAIAGSVMRAIRLPFRLRHAPSAFSAFLARVGNCVRSGQVWKPGSGG